MWVRRVAQPSVVAAAARPVWQGHPAAYCFAGQVAMGARECPAAWHSDVLLQGTVAMLY